MPPAQKPTESDPVNTPVPTPKAAKQPRTLPPLKPALAFADGQGIRYFTLSIKEWRSQTAAWARGIEGCPELDDAYRRAVVTQYEFPATKAEVVKAYRDVLTIMNRLEIGTEDGAEYEFERYLRSEVIINLAD